VDQVGRGGQSSNECFGVKFIELRPDEEQVLNRYLSSVNDCSSVPRPMARRSHSVSLSFAETAGPISGTLASIRR
jgi:hypothetical protein